MNVANVYESGLTFVSERTELWFYEKKKMENRIDVISSSFAVQFKYSISNQQL